MGHKACFIDGYNGFNNHVQTINGSRIFVTPDGVSAGRAIMHPALESAMPQPTAVQPLIKLVVELADGNQSG